MDRKMSVILTFKELKIRFSNDVDKVCKLIEKRNPDIKIDNAYKEDED